MPPIRSATGVRRAGTAPGWRRTRRRTLRGAVAQVDAGRRLGPEGDLCGPQLAGHEARGCRAATTATRWSAGACGAARRRSAATCAPIDGYWAGNPPQLRARPARARGRGADRPASRRRSRAYPYPDQYRTWPGPELQHLRRATSARSVPRARPRACRRLAVGKDYLGNGSLLGAHAERQRLPAVAARRARPRDRPRRGPGAQPARPDASASIRSASRSSCPPSAGSACSRARRHFTRTCPSLIWLDRRVHPRLDWRPARLAFGGRADRPGRRETPAAGYTLLVLSDGAC